MTMKISRMKAAQRVNRIAGAIEGFQSGGTGKTGANPMKPKRTNITVSPMTRRRGMYKEE